MKRGTRHEEDDSGFGCACRPNLPHELTEGKHLIAIMPLAKMDVSKVLWWSASDAVGNQYYSKGGGWLARKKYWRAWKKNEKKNGS